MTTVVKKATKEKVGKSSDYVAIFYVNQFGYPPLVWAVENGCGKVCGECGKVRVFNRYFGGLEFLNSRGKMHISVHNAGRQSMAVALCRRGQPEFSSETLTKKLAIFPKEGDQGRGAKGSARKYL